MQSSMSSGYFRGGGGDCLAWFRVVAFWCEQVGLTYAELSAAVQSMLQLCWLMELIFQPGIVRRTSAVPSIQERCRAASEHLRLFALAHPGQARQKNHQEWHCAAQGHAVPNCFVGEAKHKDYKTAVAHVKNVDGTMVRGHGLCQRLLLRIVGTVDSTAPEDQCCLCDPKFNRLQGDNKSLHAQAPGPCRLHPTYVRDALGCNVLCCIVHIRARPMYFTYKTSRKNCIRHSTKTSDPAQCILHPSGLWRENRSRQRGAGPQQTGGAAGGGGDRGVR